MTRRSLLHALGSVFSALLAAGCATEQRTSTPVPGDPLLGGAAPVSRERVAVHREEVPAVIAGPASTSTAAAASGTVQPLDPTHDLQNSGSRDGGTSSGDWRPRGAAADVSLLRPEPLNGPPPGQLVAQVGARQFADPPPRPATLWSGSARPLTYEAAQDQLRQHGVTWYRLEGRSDTGEVKFSCSIPNRQNPNLRRTYEGRGASDLAAILAVLARIEQEPH